MLRALALALMLAAPVAAGAETPTRVVSLNLCTDQLAMLVGDPDQIAALSPLARDPRLSAMAEAAEAFPSVDESAERVFLKAPDLVLAGTFGARETVALLRRLGFTVETFAPAASLADVRAQLLRMGELLGRPDTAAALLADFDARLAALPPIRGGAQAPRSVLYESNGITSGTGTLADDIMRAAGLSNLAAEQGIAGLARLPLEVLVASRPELIVTGRGYDHPALAQAVFEHPALQAARGAAAEAPVADEHWICGTPHVADAVAAMAQARAALPPGRTASLGEDTGPR